MVLRDVLNGSLEKWCESVSWNVSGDVFLSQTPMLKTGSVETGNDRLFPCARVDTKTKSMEGMNDPVRAQAYAHDWMNADTQQEFFTALESQFCQALRGNNGMTAGQKLLESEHMDCRRAGVVQTTSCVRMAVVASMAPKAPMAPMAPMVASMASVALMESMVVASMASMAPMAWMDLIAPELKSEREKSAVVW